jgi:F-type H+-transporting ATPase subunit delta
MKISKQARRDAKMLFRASMAAGLLDEAKARAVVAKVAEGKPRGYLAILTHYKRLVKLEQDRRSARVETAAAIDSQVQAAVGKTLATVYGAGLATSFAVNPALIGGMRVTVGSDVLDGTVAARLNRLRESF